MLIQRGLNGAGARPNGPATVFLVPGSRARALSGAGRRAALRVSRSPAWRTPVRQPGGVLAPVAAPPVQHPAPGMPFAGLGEAAALSTSRVSPSTATTVTASPAAISACGALAVQVSLFIRT